MLGLAKWPQIAFSFKIQPSKFSIAYLSDQRSQHLSENVRQLQIFRKSEATPNFFCSSNFFFKPINFDISNQFNQLNNDIALGHLICLIMCVSGNSLSIQIGLNIKYFFTDKTSYVIIWRRYHSSRRLSTCHTLG